MELTDRARRRRLAACRAAVVDERRELLLSLGVARGNEELCSLVARLPGLLCSDSDVAASACWLRYAAARWASLAGECRPAGGCEAHFPTLLRSAPGLLLLSPATMQKGERWLLRHLAARPACCRAAIVADALLSWPSLLLLVAGSEREREASCRFALLRRMGADATTSALAGSDASFLVAHGIDERQWRSHRATFMRLWSLLHGAAESRMQLANE